MDQRDLELVEDYERLTAQFHSLLRSSEKWDSPHLVAVMAEMDRVGDELQSRQPPSPPIPMPQWLLDKYPNLSNLSGQKLPSKRSRLLRPLVRVAKPVVGAYSRARGRWVRWWINKRDADLYRRYRSLAGQALKLAERGVAPESAELLRLYARMDRVAADMVERLR